MLISGGMCAPRMQVLFEPSLDALVGRLVTALNEGVRPVRPRFEANHNEQVGDLDYAGHCALC
jgi:hypothetical protein